MVPDDLPIAATDEKDVVEKRFVAVRSGEGAQSFHGAQRGATTGEQDLLEKCSVDV